MKLKQHIIIEDSFEFDNVLLQYKYLIDHFASFFPLAANVKMNILLYVYSRTSFRILLGSLPRVEFCSLILIK